MILLRSLYWRLFCLRIYFWAFLEFIYSVICSACLRNNMIAFSGAGYRHSVFKRAVSLSLQLANITNTTIPVDCREYIWGNLFDGYHISSALLHFPAVIFSEYCNDLLSLVCTVTTLCTKAPFNLHNPPSFPFDQRHSRLIKPWITSIFLLRNAFSKRHLVTLCVWTFGVHEDDWSTNDNT